MKKKKNSLNCRRKLSLLLFFTLILSCVNQEVEETEPVVEPVIEPVIQEEVEFASDPNSEILVRMQDYLENGLTKIEQGSISEGIKLFVSVLAEKVNLAEPLGEASEILLKAENELEQLENTISLDADSMWIDSDKNRITGNTLKPYLQPNVILKVDAGEAVVQDVPVYFEFIKGAGSVKDITLTDSYGKAGCIITDFENPDIENVIRAGIEYKVGDFSYSFNSVTCDFVYMPPPETASIIVLEKSELGVSNNPMILNPVFNELSRIDYEFTIYEDNVDYDLFMDLFKGNSIDDLGLDSNISYIIMLLNDCNDLLQMTDFQGNPIDAFMSEAIASIRVIRVSDGRVLYEKEIERNRNNGLHGQGSSKYQAALDVQRDIAGDLALDIRVNLSEIQRALLGN